MRLSLVIIFALLLGRPAWSWGPVGHRMVAESAALLLEKQSDWKDWGKFLARHRFEMGYYSMVPDAIYRYRDGSQGQIEAPTHFFYLDLALGLPNVNSQASQEIERLPLRFPEVREALTHRHGGKDRLAAEIGTSPWRMEQFLKLAQTEFKDIKAVQGSYQPGATSTGEAKRIYNGIFYLGVLSHYTSDSVFPYHATGDWNGWETGQGGIHFFYEADCVNALEPGLSDQVLKEALKNQKKWLKTWKGKDAEPVDPIRMMYRVLLEGGRDVPKLSKLDREKVMIRESDKAAKKFSMRKPSSEVCRHAQPFLVEWLAKSTVLTTYMWERALPTQVDFTRAPMLQFSDIESNPSFTAPDYLSGSTAPSGKP